MDLVARARAPRLLSPIPTFLHSFLSRHSSQSIPCLRGTKGETASWTAQTHDDALSSSRGQSVVTRRSWLRRACSSRWRLAANCSDSEIEIKPERQHDCSPGIGRCPRIEEENSWRLLPQEVVLFWAVFFMLLAYQLPYQPPYQIVGTVDSRYGVGTELVWTVMERRPA